MGDKSAIEWTDATWNPVTGCTKISAGCKFCYAERLAERFRGVAKSPYVNGFDLTLHEEKLGLPDRWKRPRRIFVNSMSDLFHKDVPDRFIEDVMQVMRRNPRHTFQVLTKRPERMAELWGLPGYVPQNVWCGTSIENDVVLERMNHLGRVSAPIKFLSCEPLIGSLLRTEESGMTPSMLGGAWQIEGIKWVIVGGESGPQHRPMEDRWVSEIHLACAVGRIPFFFKQWGGVHGKDGGRVWRGQEWNQMPEVQS